MAESCVCCNGSHFSTLTYRDEFEGAPLLRCEVCGHIQVERIPDPEQLHGYYVDKYSPKRAINVGSGYRRLMERRAEAQLDYCLKEGVVGFTSLLDVGCGYGFLLRIASRHEVPCIGLEYDPAAVRYGADQGLKINRIASEGNIVSAISALAKGGLVAMSHTLEHLREPEAVLKACLNCRVFIEVPAYRVDIPEQFADQEGHLNFFNSASLLALLHRLGFVVEAHGCFGPGIEFFNRRRWSLPLQSLRTLSRDYFLNQYQTRRENGIWIRVLARGGACK